MFTITDSWLREHSINTGFGHVWTNAQLAVVGLRKPLVAGWMHSLVGREISDADKQKFEESVTIVTPKTARSRKRRLAR